MNSKQIRTLLKLCQEYNVDEISFHGVQIKFRPVSKDTSSNTYQSAQPIPPMQATVNVSPVSQEPLPLDAMTARRQELELLLHSEITDPSEIDKLL